MIIDSFDIVFYTAIFVLPGFVVCSIIDSINPPKKHSEATFLLRYIGFSLVNCAAWCWLYKIVIECSNISSLYRWLLLFAISLVGSVLVGLLIAIFKQHQVIDRILNKLKIKTIHTIPTAWDYYFSKQLEGFIIITLIDDTKLYGWYGSNSFTSSDPDERDIYVEYGYQIDEDGKWILDKQSEGFYIPKDQIKYIELKRGNENGQ